MWRSWKGWRVILLGHRGGWADGWAWHVCEGQELSSEVLDYSSANLGRQEATFSIHTDSYIYRSSFPKQFTVGFSMQPRCVRLGVGGCVLLPWAIVSLCLAGLVAASFALVFFFSFQLCGFWSFLTSLVRHFLNFCSGLGVGVHPLGL